jgi:hypothetical protein
MPCTFKSQQNNLFFLFYCINIRSKKIINFIFIHKKINFVKNEVFHQFLAKDDRIK